MQRIITSVLTFLFYATACAVVIIAALSLGGCGVANFFADGRPVACSGSEEPKPYACVATPGASKL